MKRGGLGTLLGIALAVSSEAGTLDDLARELPRIKPLEPAAALSSFRIHPGFHLEQVAAEPMVINPVSACCDADGRLYVVEMCGYPYPEKTPSRTRPGAESGFDAAERGHGHSSRRAGRPGLPDQSP